MALDRERRWLAAEQAARVRAPETTKLADLLTALSEAQSDERKHSAVGLIAGTVGDWSRRGRNLNGPEVVVVVEAVVKALGARV